MSATSTPTAPSTPSVPTPPSNPTPAPSTPHVPTPKARVQDFAFRMKPNRWFRIKGNDFGLGGTVTIGGAKAQTASWATTEIEGKVPDNIHSGEVIVHVDDKVKKYGYFG